MLSTHVKSEIVVYRPNDDLDLATLDFKARRFVTLHALIKQQVEGRSVSPSRREWLHKIIMSDLEDDGMFGAEYKNEVVPDAAS